MEDRELLLQRTGLRELSKFLMDTDGVYVERTDAGGMTAAGRQAQLRDNLELAMRDINEETRMRVRETAGEIWARGEDLGFMEGMRAGARIVLALLGDGEILI
ncbi:MAG: hypothetical protein HDT14_13335 [Oscillibacter sp.]|nr:hypothetical protein [Oscillibacter sp.]